MSNQELINKIATRANRMHRTKKAEAFENLKVLIASISAIGDPSTLREVDVEKLLASLYIHFTPTPSAKYKRPLDILKRIMPKNDVRYYLNSIYADSEHIVATDGHRLALIPNKDNLETGFYDRNMVRFDLNANYPDYKRVLPVTRSSVVITQDQIKIIEGKPELAVFYLTKGIPFYCQASYLKDFTNGLGEFEVLFDHANIRPKDTWYSSSINIVRGDMPELTTVLMPVIDPNI